MLYELTKPAPSNTRRIKGNIDLMTIKQATAISYCLCDKNVILFLERWMDIIKKERKRAETIGYVMMMMMKTAIFHRPPG